MYMEYLSNQSRRQIAVNSSLLTALHQNSLKCTNTKSAILDFVHC